MTVVFHRLLSKSPDRNVQEKKKKKLPEGAIEQPAVHDASSDDEIITP